MHAQKSERRKNPRVFFLKNEDINARLKKLGGEEAFFQVLVKDLSLAGIGCILKRTEPEMVSPGDQLVITTLQGTKAPDFLTQSTLKVEWVLDTDILDHIGFGGSFLNLDRAILAKLDEYVSSWR